MFSTDNYIPSNETKYSRKEQIKLFKGCLPQVLLRPFLNILSQMLLHEQNNLKHDPQ